MLNEWNSDANKVAFWEEDVTTVGDCNSFAVSFIELLFGTEHYTVEEAILSIDYEHYTHPMDDIYALGGNHDLCFYN